MKPWITGITCLCLTAAACGDGAEQVKEQPTDSQMVAEHVDPSTRFPQQVVEADSVSSDARFVDNTIQLLDKTLVLTELARQRANHEEIKRSAQSLSAGYGQLKAALLVEQRKDRKKDALPSYTDGSEQELAGLNGAAFDKKWVEKLITRNAAIITQYEAEGVATKEKKLKRLVEEALPVLKKEQQNLENCKDKLQ